jgi:hypothetical protein
MRGGFIGAASLRRPRQTSVDHKRTRYCHNPPLRNAGAGGLNDEAFKFVEDDWATGVEL